MSKYLLRLVQAQYSVQVASHTVYVSVLCEEVSVQLATGNLLYQNVIAA